MAGAASSLAGASSLAAGLASSLAGASTTGAASTISAAKAVSTGFSAAPISTPAAIAPSVIPSRIASAIKSQNNEIDRTASSLPGIGISTSSGLQLLSRSAIMGMPSLRASLIAIVSLVVSITKIRFGILPISLIPPKARSSLSFSRVSFSNSFLVRPDCSIFSSMPSSSRKRAIDFEIVCQFVSIPPSQR